MILGQGMDVETLQRHFKQIRHPRSFLGFKFCYPGSRIDPRNLTIDNCDCWLVLHQAWNENWIGLTQKIRGGGLAGSGTLGGVCYQGKREKGGVWMPQRGPPVPRLTQHIPLNSISSSRLLAYVFTHLDNSICISTRGCTGFLFPPQKEPSCPLPATAKLVGFWCTSMDLVASSLW